MIKYSGILLILHFLTTFSLAQTPFFTEHELDSYAEEVRFGEMLEHSNGRIYLGSDQGLFYYDGLSIKVLPAKDTLIQHEITALYEDHLHQLWIGDEKGNIYQLDEIGTIKLWSKQLEIESPVIGFVEDQKGGFWIATYGQGAYYLKGDTSVHFQLEDQLLGEDVYAMVICAQDKVWLGTDNGVSVCSYENGKKEVLNVTKADGLPDEIIREIITDANGDLWFGTNDKGVCHFSASDWKVDFCLPDWNYGAVSRLAVFEEKELWIGTKNKGLWKYSFEEQQLLPIVDQKEGVNNKIYDLLKDTEGNLWVLSNSYKLCSTNRQFDFLPTPLSDIQTCLLSQNNQLWIGTQNGLYINDWGIKTKEFKQVLETLNLNVISIFEDEYNNIWIGTFGEGLFIFHPLSGKIRHILEEDGLTNGSILSITGKEGHVWLATLGGVSEIHCRGNILFRSDLTIKNFNHDSGIGTNFIYKVFIDSRERIWFGTDGKGVGVLENGIIKSYLEAEGNPIKSVYSITEDGRGHIWISTDKKGIYEFDGTVFKKFQGNKIIRNSNISSLAADLNGNLVIIHDFGLDIYNPSSGEISYFGAEAGLGSFDPNLNAVHADKNGNLWIGTQSQIVKYSRKREGFRKYPLIHINGVSIYKEPIDFLNENRFAHDQNSLVFSFLGTWNSNPSALRYHYKLEGHDQDWISSKDQQATYYSLPYGSYNFMVKASINGDFPSEEVATYRFNILKPFWRQWWFILLFFTLLSSLVWGGMRAREQRLHREAILKKEKVESQFETLKSQINPHFLFNCFNTLITIIEENPILATTYVEKLADYYRNIIQYREKDLIDLREEMDLVENYTYLLRERYGDNFSLEYQVENSKVFVAPLTLQMLVENAVKHNIISKSKPLKIAIEENGEYLYVINNLQPKLVKEVSTGFGLQNIKNRYDLLSDKKVRISEENDQFKVAIPLIKEKDLQPDW